MHYSLSVGVFMVRESPWPVFVSIGIVGLIKSAIEGCWDVLGGLGVLVGWVSLLLVLVGVYEWCRNVVGENQSGAHLFNFNSCLYFGFILFLLTELMLFFSFFWAFLSNSWNPEVGAGCCWPPFECGPLVVDALGLPFLNTVILLSSGATVTAAHHQTLGGRGGSVGLLIVSAGLGLIFLILQGWEYAHALFSLGGGIFGSGFYMLTGLHGFHVCVGGVLLGLCAIKGFVQVVSSGCHAGLQLSLWYWHFVDVVWVCLFLLVYWYA
uniref:Cytochrome c oxidase subunit 3 n=1 Tax=Graffilla buccinicola TaxID=84095 RepID=A0A7G5XUI8_9PLAT|nr:cytochrome c oxidase subunit III [Graffilla buccinicola]QNA49623.1 cytochrome c oxidase subunit 3 [Graffilla buccinicola]